MSLSTEIFSHTAIVCVRQLMGVVIIVEEVIHIGIVDIALDARQVNA